MLFHSKVEKFFDLLLDHSVKITKEDVLLIKTDDVPPQIVARLIEKAYERGAKVLVKRKSSIVLASQIPDISSENLNVIASNELHESEICTAYISLYHDINPYDLSDVPSKDIGRWRKKMREVSDGIIDNKKWVLAMWPGSTSAQMASKSTDAFTEYLLDVSTIDYPKMSKACIPLAERMSRGKDVYIKAPGTDLRFSIEGLPAIPCTGEYNVPDGECFSCPVKDSVQGEITYNVPSTYQNHRFDHIYFKINNGKIIEAHADQNSDKLNEILDSDEGARYFGEWAIGFHPLITEPMKDILFDEKIAGSMHFTPGRAYKDCYNGNNSSVHWDLVQIHRHEYGGGEIWLDGELIRKDGIFVLDDLKGLNPDQLLD